MGAPKKNDEDKKAKILTVRLGVDEEAMVEELKGYPYFVNISEFIRASIKHFHESKTKTKTKTKTKEN